MYFKLVCAFAPIRMFVCATLPRPPKHPSGRGVLGLAGTGLASEAAGTPQAGGSGWHEPCYAYAGVCVGAPSVRKRVTGAGAGVPPSVARERDGGPERGHDAGATSVVRGVVRGVCRADAGTRGGCCVGTTPGVPPIWGGCVGASAVA